MRLSLPPLGKAILASLFLILQIGLGIGEPQPQNSYYNYPGGKLQTLQSQSPICGDCPAGTQRELVSGPYCGKCIANSQTCAAGYYLNNGQCNPCPCPDPSGQRRFGTSCHVDQNGQVVCECPSEYTGPDCSQCAPGAIRNNQPPYNCMWTNNTNSFSVTCPAGNRCPQPSIPNIVQQRPPQTGLCPYTNGGGCPAGTACQTGGCPTPGYPCQQQGGCPVNPITCPGGNGNGGGCPCPAGACGCPPNSCPGSCPPCNPQNPPQNGAYPPTQAPPIIPPWTPPPPISGCPGPVQCPLQPPQITPGCPLNPVNPINPYPQCPYNTPIGPCPQPPTPCNTCNPGGGSTICPNPCPNPCQTCPPIPACPPCELTCPSCPGNQPCPVCGDGNCTICPSPCAPCPSICPQCPNPVECPACSVSCPPCPSCPGGGGGNIEFRVSIEPCICDPRGTASQIGNQCMCKVNAQGARCDQCKRGYFGLSSTRPEGCVACFCSGLTDSCSSTPYYRTYLRTNRSANCTIEITDDQHTVVYSQGTSGFSFNGDEATLSKSATRRLFWSLPSCLKGNRVTSYGGVLSFARRCSGSGNSLGADHEVILVGSNGATIFWTTFETQKCTGVYSQMDVLLSESAYWSSWTGGNYRRASRGDIMEVLANLQLILIRATFTSNTQTTSIKNVTLSTVTHVLTQDEVVMHVESCRCPTGYTGLSCESCAPGYYRDTNDLSKSIFGACKKCPCSKTADGCHFSNGHVVCSCKSGFTGPLCQDKEVITLSADPFRIREVEGAVVDFTCSFTTNSKRPLLLKLGEEGKTGPAEDVTSLTRTIKLSKGLRRVSCEVVDNSGASWACVYSSVELIPPTAVMLPPPPRVIAVIPKQTFVCVNETSTVTLSCSVHNFGMRKVQIEWRREGSAKVLSYGENMTIHTMSLNDAGTYICSASDGDVTGAGQIAVMVRRVDLGMRLHYPVNATSDVEYKIHSRHGGDYPNYPYQGDAPVGGVNATTGGGANKNNPPATGGRLSSIVLPKVGPSPKGHPQAIVEPAEVTARPGDTVILRCNATGEEPLKFYWKAGNNDYIPVHVRVSHGALVFRSIRSQDAGVYYCIAWNHLGQATARATIKLDNSVAEVNHNTIDSPRNREPLTVQVLHPEITVRAGENVNFLCRTNVTSGVEYHWTRIGEKMPNSSEIRKDGLLSLYRVSESDKGNYLCTVVSQYGEKATAQAQLKITKAGEILIMPTVSLKPRSPLRVRTGAKVRLECESSGSPTPNVTWVRSVDGVDKKLVSSTSNRTIYEIKQMSKADVGKYTCFAVNPAGSKSESMSVVIDDGHVCKDNEFRCKSGDQCIPREDRCDAEKDCRDGSDEANCKGSRRVRSQFKK